MERENKKGLSIAPRILHKMKISHLLLIVLISCSTPKKQDPPKQDIEIVNVGSKLQTQFFDITVNKVELKSSIYTYYRRERPEPGNAYLIINTTFYNSGTESRLITDGVILFYIGEKQYLFDKSEVFLSEKYGLKFDQINPMTSKTTNLVYQIPIGIVGDAYYAPGRSEADKFIFLGKIDSSSLL